MDTDTLPDVRSMLNLKVITRRTFIRFIEPRSNRYFLPFIGHMGIATTAGIIRDFAGPYHVSEDKMAFGQPTKYWQLDCNRAKGGPVGWDLAVAEASEIYKTRMVKNLPTD